MKTGRLTDYFLKVAWKALSQVEVGDSVQYHQHEFNGVAALRDMFGTEKQKFPAKFLFFDDEVNDAANGFMTWYDARENHPTRTEFRFYFSGSFITEHSKVGNVLIMALRPDHTILVIVCAQEAAILPQLLWLFGISAIGDKFAIRDEAATGQTSVGAAARFILTQIGIEPEPKENDDGLLDAMLAHFHGGFPSTSVFSAFARNTVKGDCRADPDGILVLWMEREERLFKLLEQYLVEKRLEQGFVGENRVDDFVTYSLSVQNRRKSRAGAALENHFEYLLQEWQIRNSRTPVTEGNSKPDFLFPGIEAYRDPAFPAFRLTMLGAKTTAKDRWRQILAEADRIPEKHLLTLQVGISKPQLAEMATHHVVPVIPQAFRQTYAAGLQRGILTVADFLRLVESRQ